MYRPSHAPSTSARHDIKCYVPEKKLSTVDVVFQNIGFVSVVLLLLGLLNDCAGGN